MHVLYAHLWIYEDSNRDKALISDGIPYCATESAFQFPGQENVVL